MGDRVVALVVACDFATTRLPAADAPMEEVKMQEGGGWLPCVAAYMPSAGILHVRQLACAEIPKAIIPTVPADGPPQGPNICDSSPALTAMTANSMHRMHCV